MASSSLFTIAKAKDKRYKRALSGYLTTLRKIKPSIAGKDLKKMGYSPGPLYTEILKAVLDERLEGNIKSREEEVQFVKKRFPLQVKN
jgi:tRNA nucleotidyltransferase (CCA-adding enzyme)